MSPIKFRYISLTHPQTPINRSLPKAFRHTPRHLGRDLGRHQDIQSISSIKEDSEVPKLCRNQASKSSRTSTSKSKNIQSKTFQTINLDLEVCWNQAQKPLKTLTNYKSTKLYGFKPLKYRRTSTANLRRRRMHQVQEEHEEQRISNKLIAQNSL